MSDDTTTAKLSRDVFIALAAVAWSDGALEPDEADGIVRAALESGLSLDEIESIQAATKSRVELTSLDPKSLDMAERTFVYACAVWLARMDGHVEPAEKDALVKLGELLGIPDRVRTQASAAALEVAQEEGSDRPDRYDFHALRARIDERLEAIVARYSDA